ncbi:MAG: glucose-1-phosphate adenylyltransferase subunit GlgD [Eubacteriaceae bacterium]|nr:glucose-1-phosphate adenylyltransferase subunit GlgD [Eubacteriaceae bacterium]MBR0383146.1 glucose-1-phosphate adenylyltransferase subunit GlgD [Eubacteriaceae bacterium]
MQNTIGYILNIDGENTDLNELLQHRSVSTLPFGGRYRLLDFTMSNLVNSGVNHIGVVGSYKYSSLIDHLGTGKEWSLSRKTQNLSILAGASGVRYGDNIKVSVRDLFYNIPFLSKGSNVKDVIICSPNLVTSFDFSTAHRIHRTNNADITMIFKKVHPDFNANDNDVFVEFEKFRVSKLYHQTGETAEHVFADMMIIKRDVLIDLVKKANELGEWDLMDVIHDNMDTLRVFGAPHTGYLSRVNDMKRFFEANMDLLNYDVMNELFMGENPVYTKIKDNHPTHYSNDAEVTKSIVGSGCQIQAKIKNSVLFRDSIIGNGTDIDSCIIMQKANIGDNVTLKYVIMDKDCHIRDNTSLIGTKENPIIISKGRSI